MRLRYLGLWVFIQTPIILAIGAAITGQSILLFTLLGLIVGGASFIVAAVVESQNGAKPHPPTTVRLSRQAVLGKIRLSFLITTPLVIFHGLLTGYSAIEWMVIPAFSGVIAVVCGIMWAISGARWSTPERRS